MSNSTLSQAIRHALVTGAAATAAMLPLHAIAQDQAEEETTTLDRIEVTGSRIKRVDIETSQPIFQLNREDIQAQGLTSVGDVIQNLTTNGTTLNTTMNNGGNGETRVSLRNLGSVRTLVLVNGRRWVGNAGGGLDGAVDLNSIPTAAVERIEVLKDGASVIYGSDAIAGVVNVILRDEFEGAEASAFIGQFDKGDGTRQSYDFTIGTVADRFSAMLGVAYIKEDPVMAGDREISKEPIFGTSNFAGSSNTPFGRFALGEPGALRRPDGSAGFWTYDPGSTGDDWRPYVDGVGGDAYNFAPENYLLTPQERVSLFANGKLDITDNLRFKVTTQYNERRSEQLAASMPIALGLGPQAPANAGDIFISEDSYYNPFGEQVTSIQRRAVETAGRRSVQDVDTFVFNAGLEGSFEIGERYFDWDLGYFFGENEHNDTAGGLFSLPALRQGLGPSFLDTDGVVKCGTPGNVIAGCVPINLLGAPGSLTPEMLAFATINAHNTRGYEQKTHYANITGELFDLPGGAFAFAAGVETRKESGFDEPDALVNSGNTTGNARTATRGGYDVDEAYLELSIPVLADVPGAQLLDFSLATRMSDYSNFGDTTNSKFGFRWKPIEDLMVRGNYTEGFRAPSVGELFQGQADSFPQLLDPCSTGPSGNRFAGLTPDQQARCLADGVSAGGYDQGNPQIRITIGGNPDLEPETATTKTLGLVYSPGWAEGLDVALDWWRIELENSITVFGGNFIIDKCIKEGVRSFCDLYDRADGGAVSNLLASNLNAGFTNVEGYDLTIGYRLPEMDWGRLSFVWDTTYLSVFETDLDADGVISEIDGGNLVGEYGLGATGSNNWRIRSNLSARWELDDWYATWFTRFYSRQDAPCILAGSQFEDLCTDPARMIDVPTDTNGDGIVAPGEVAPGPAPEHRMGSTTYHDVAVGWKAPWNASITLGVNNLFDKDPPVVYDSGAAARSFNAQYDVPGRFYYLRYTQKF